jgi:hypothetical protein
MVTAAGYAVISPQPPPNPRSGTVWVQPINPIVDLTSPDALTDDTFWSWAGFGYGYPGLSFTPEAGGMRVNWNPAPAQAPDHGQMACAPFTGNIYEGHQLLVQMTVNVPAGSPDIRLTHAFTSSSRWVTEKDQDITVSLPILWSPSMNRLIGPESAAPAGAGSVLVKDIHVYDLTTSPPSPMRVWDPNEQVWLPINDGLVQRAGDRMVGDLRFDTVDAANKQPTVTGLPTPTDDTDAVPLNFLQDALAALDRLFVSVDGDDVHGSLVFQPDPSKAQQPTVTGLPDPVDDTDAVPLGFLNTMLAGIGGGGGANVIVAGSAPPGVHAVGQLWLDPTVEPTYAESFEYGWPGGVVPVAANVHDSLTTWSKCRWIAPADGVLRWSIVVTWSATGSTDCYTVFFVNGVEQPAATLASTSGGVWVPTPLNGLLAVTKGTAYEMRPGVLLTGAVTGSAFTARLTAEFIPDSKMARVNG